MAAGLEERIGGNLPATAVHQLYEQMQHAPVQPAIRMLERRVTLAFQVLEVDQKDPLIWVCLNAWLEVRKCNSREGASARLMAIQDAGNVERVSRHLHRSVPEDVKSPRELVVGFGVCRILPLERPDRLRGGLRGADDIAAVLIPLQEWSPRNGLFCETKLIPGQGICLGGAEEVIFPGTGDCLVLMLFLKLPRTEV